MSNTFAIKIIYAFMITPLYKRLISISGFIIGIFLLIGSAGVANAQSSFEQSVFVSGLGQPTTSTFAPDGRLFVSEKKGKLRVIENGVLLSTPFVTITDISFQSERGLLGIAFDPQFSTNGYIYVFYTYNSGGGGNRVSRFTADTTNPNVAAPGSEVIILDGIPATDGNHNAGSIHFGPDGKLYVAVGDTGISSNSQSLSTLAGKILRIDAVNYPNIIPADNPFVSVPGARQEIWALGLRNPFTFSFDPTDGKMYINDVGQGMWEEINQGAPGANFGWPICEGPLVTGFGNCSNPSLTYPIYAYPHPDGFAITGGTFYYANQFPSEYAGSYFFGDYVGNWIRRLLPGTATPSPFMENITSPVDLDVGPDGKLYVLSIGGSIYRIQYAYTNASPVAVMTVNPTSGLPPLDVNFDATSSTDADGDPLTYTWNFGDGSVTSSVSTTTHTYTTPGNFQATLRVEDGQGGQDTKNTVIVVGNPPVGSIDTPTAGTFYSAGEEIAYSGSGSDIDDGTLSPAAFSWTIVFYHNTHTHPYIGPIDGVTSGSFIIPTGGETETDVFYRIHLTVTDSNGLTHESTRDITPRTATLNLLSDPPGMTITLDGQPMVTPINILSVVGMTRMLGAPTPQANVNGTYTFLSWSDGGVQTHSITTPAINSDYTATFEQTAPPSLPKENYLTFNNLDGAYDHVLVENSSNTAELTPLTVSAWARTPAFGYSMQIVAKGALGFEQWVIRRNPSNGKIVFNVREQFSNTLISAESPKNQGRDGAWHHYAGVYDPAAGVIKLYIDGSAATSTTGIIDEPMRNDDEPICIGAYALTISACSTASGWKGDIDDVRIYNRVLTAGEIQSAMNFELTGSEQGLIAYWRMNEGSGQTLMDSTVNVLSGRLGSTPSTDTNDPGWVTSQSPTPTPTPSPTPSATPTPTPVPDTQAPTVTITNPINGSIIPKGSMINIQATASDNVGVTMVEFYVNGKRRCTDFALAYECAYTLPVYPNVIYTILAKAYDVQNNTSTHQVVITSSN